MGLVLPVRGTGLPEGSELSSAWISWVTPDHHHRVSFVCPLECSFFVLGVITGDVFAADRYLDSALEN